MWLLLGYADEIDAIGKARGQGTSDPGTAEREQGLMQLLCEMDGMMSDDKVGANSPSPLFYRSGCARRVF